MTGCQQCEDFYKTVPIELPSDLERVLRIVKEAVAENTLTVLEEETKWCGPFSQLSAAGGWDDILHYTFACTSCGQRFLLSAETYHGSGGDWRPET